MGKTWKYKKYKGRRIKRKSKKRKSNLKPLKIIQIDNKNNVKVFGHVFSDSCGFCRQMEPEWLKLTELLAETRKNIIIIDIGDNYSENLKKINDNYQVNLEANGLPTIFRISDVNKRNVLEYYKGERTADLMMAWLMHG